MCIFFHRRHLEPPRFRHITPCILLQNQKDRQDQHQYAYSADRASPPPRRSATEPSAPSTTGAHARAIFRDCISLKRLDPAWPSCFISRMATGRGSEKPDTRRGFPSSETSRTTLWHYTTWPRLRAICESSFLNPSLRSSNPRDARYGDGQYVTDIPPGTLPPERLAYALVRSPYASRRFTHYLEVDVTGLEVVCGREHVYVIPSRLPLDLRGRIVSWGKNGLVPPGGVAS